MEDLFKALQMFQQGVQQYATTSAINDATKEFNRLNEDVKNKAITEQQGRVALQNLSNNVALRLTGLGASGAHIQSAFNAIAPQNFGSAEQMQLEGQLSGNQGLINTSEGIINQREQKDLRKLKAQALIQEESDNRKMERMLALEAMKQRKAAGSQNIAGLVKVDPEIILDRPVINKTIEGMDKFRNLASAMNRLEKMVEDVGTESFSVFSNKSSEMESLYGHLILQAKEAYNLGVLQQIDENKLKEILPDPTSFTTSGWKYKARIKSLKEQMKQDLNNTAIQRGYKVDPRLFKNLGMGEDTSEFNSLLEAARVK